MSIICNISYLKKTSKKLLTFCVIATFVSILIVLLLNKPITTIDAEKELAKSSKLFLTFIRKDLTSNDRKALARTPLVIYDDPNDPVYLKTLVSDIRKIEDNSANEILENRTPFVTIKFDEHKNIDNTDERNAIKAIEVLENNQYKRARTQYDYITRLLKISLLHSLNSHDKYLDQTMEYRDNLIIDETILKNISIEEIDKEPRYSHGLFRSLFRQKILINSIQNIEQKPRSFHPLLFVDVEFAINRLNNKVDGVVLIKSLDNQLQHKIMLNDIQFFLENSYIEFSNAIEW
jgi:hypothetical protein